MCLLSAPVDSDSPATTAPTLLTLTPDVLRPILAQLPPSTIRALALASHTAHSIALFHLFANVTLGGAFHRPAHALSPDAQLRTFCTSILKHPTRAALVRSLEVRRDAVKREKCYEIDATAVALLSEVIGRASGLRRVTIWGLAALVEACPSIVGAFSKCERLETVIIGGEVPSVDVLQSAFPYVRTLEVIEGGGASPASVVTHRPVHNVPHTSGGPWPTLDRLSTGRPLPVPSSSSIKTRQLTLLDPVTNDPVAIKETLAFIRHMRPVVLSATVDADVADEDFVARLHEVCVGDGRDRWQGVRYLKLALSGCMSLAGVEGWMTRTASLLSALPLHSLALWSTTPAAFPTPRPSPAVSPLSTPLSSPLPRRNSAAELPDPVGIPELDGAKTAYGKARTPPPAMRALAKSVAAVLPELTFLGLAPFGPASEAAFTPVTLDTVSLRAAHADGTNVCPCEWFEVGDVQTKKLSVRCLDGQEANVVEKRLERLGRWD